MNRPEQADEEDRCIADHAVRPISASASDGGGWYGLIPPWPFLRRSAFWGLLCNLVGMLLMAFYAGDPYVSVTAEPSMFGLKSAWWFRAGLFLNVVGFGIRMAEVMITADAKPLAEAAIHAACPRTDPPEKVS